MKKNPTTSNTNGPMCTLSFISTINIQRWRRLGRCIFHLERCLAQSSLIKTGKNSERLILICSLSLCNWDIRDHSLQWWLHFCAYLLLLLLLFSILVKQYHTGTANVKLSPKGEGAAMPSKLSIKSQSRKWVQTAGNFVLHRLTKKCWQDLWNSNYI